MEATFPLLLAAVVGFTHAFEADHLLAVSTIVTRRKHPLQAVKDGIFWGLGHSSTIFLIGLLMIAGKIAITESTFHWLEAGVGLMLVLLGAFRLWRMWRRPTSGDQLHNHEGGHRLAYGVGAVHGLAGSGALIVLVMSQLHTVGSALIYLLIFGLGSLAGMLLASGVFSLPFSKKWSSNLTLQAGLTLLSSLLCMGFGLKVIIENLAA